MQAAVERPLRLHQLQTALARSPVVAVLGPRQCGKTSLSRLVPASARFDLDRSSDAQALAIAPEQTLGALDGIVVIDEVQKLPSLFPVLRTLADRPGSSTRFLLLGSASPDLVRGASESLAGRVAFVQLSGFDVHEVGSEHTMRLWHRGTFPRSFLASDEAASYAWRQDFVDTFLSRDASQFGIRMPPAALRRFWTMLAHGHGGEQNCNELAAAFGIDQKTAKHYVDVLVGTFLVRRLPPWFHNTKKRLVKSPRLYLRDAGLLHALLGLRDGTEILSHPRFGHSWEGFAIEHVITAMRAEHDACFWAVHAGAELDLVVPRGGRLYGFECKFADAPTITKSMQLAIGELGLEQLFVVVPGGRSVELASRIRALPLGNVQQELAGL